MARTHRERLARIGSWAGPPPKSAERQKLERLARQAFQKPETRKTARRRSLTARAYVAAQMMNGAGLPMDSLLREYLFEYNGRIMAHDLWAMPTSFNLIEAFLSFNPSLMVMQLRDERDFIISFPEFVDFITEPGRNIDLGRILHVAADGVIYSYNAHSPIDAMRFSITAGKEFVLGGISLIRHKEEVTVIMLCGEVCDLAEENVKLKSMEKDRPAPGREDLHPHPDHVTEAVPLFDDQSFWRLIAMTRFDLSNRTQQVRALYYDIGRSYIGWIDEPGAYLDVEASKTCEKTGPRKNVKKLQTGRGLGA